MHGILNMPSPTRDADDKRKRPDEKKQPETDIEAPETPPVEPPPVPIEDPPPDNRKRGPFVVSTLT